MKDSTIIGLGIISAMTIITIACILKKKDNGMMIQRDAQGNIVAVLPLSVPYIDNTATAAQLNDGIDYSSIANFQETGS